MLWDYWSTVENQLLPEIESKINARWFNFMAIHIGPHRYDCSLRHGLYGEAMYQFRNEAYVMGADYWAGIGTTYGGARDVDYLSLSNGTYSELELTKPGLVVWQGLEGGLDYAAKKAVNAIIKKYATDALLG